MIPATSLRTRQYDLDLARALGIIFVVFYHYYTPKFLYLQADSFTIPLFFFISGYFFKTQIGLKNKANKVWNRARVLLVPYFAYNTVFAVITALIHTFSSKIRWGQYPTLYNFFVEPFISGHQYHLFIPAWFVPVLFEVEAIHIFLYHNYNDRPIIDIIYFVFYLAMSLLAVYSSFSGASPTLKLVLIHLAFGIFFYYLGYIYHRYLENKLNKKANGSWSFAIAFVILCLLESVYGSKIGYSPAWARFPARVVWLPFVTSICGIYLTLIISKALAKYFSDQDDILYQIGQETYHIMCLHVAIFALFNTILIYFVLPNRNLTALANIWFKYKPGTTWPLYVGSGLLLPTWLAPLVRKYMQHFSCKDKIFSLFRHAEYA